jgi:antitoxin (DNA-binding transcriptional repressor) of toxin-antitoxin stability system
LASSAKVRLSHLVETASQGEEIWLTVRGKPEARLCQLVEKPAHTETKVWLHTLSEVRAEDGQPQTPGQGQDIWDDLRGE